jgi:gamma-glutamyl-gamma-aminobutyrate hydrolase PuuD/very-short-patch-repair endonuclease
MKNKENPRPVIGFTLDYEEGGGYSKMPWYALRENYCSSVSRFGAVPLPLPHELAMVDDYLDMIDGLIVTGGAFDVPPNMYGDTSQHSAVTTKNRRTAFEFAITRGALDRNIPILGICGGQQLLNVVLGGTLIQHIPDTVANALEHEQKNPRTEPGHNVAITPNTLLHHILTPSPLRGEAGRGAPHIRRYPLKNTLDNAKNLRKTLTEPEKLLWQLLRGEQLGVKFRKQHPIGPYIADFACLNPKLIIELDGGQHNEDAAIEKDTERSHFLEQQGFTVLRFWNNEVFKQTEAVMERIYDQLHGKNSPHPNPPPAGEGIITIAVNSAHHQAVAKPAPGTIVNATAPDGVIEGIEYPPHRFCLGVQWHPEYFVTEADEKIMRAFVDEAKA